MNRQKIRSLFSPRIRAQLRRWLDRLQVPANFAADRRRFLRWSSTLREPKDRWQLAAHLTMDYHRIEKGLALPDPRVGFGSEVIERLVSNLQVYAKRYGEDTLFMTVIAALNQYSLAQERLNFVNVELNAFLQNFKSEVETSRQVAGTITLEAKASATFQSVEAEIFLRSRHSMRQYTGELVPNGVIEKIVELAQKAPSVCNRQSGRLYAANSRQKMAEVLAFQNGNRGFGHTLGGLFVVTSDLRNFVNLGERNQAFVDGGIFAQQTLLAIHSQHLGGCMLNWSVTKDQDRRLRELLLIPDHDVVITMIGFGFPAKDAVVAASPRIEKGDVLRYLN